jgi:hypothetical protein
MAKYQVQTDQGTYEVETDDSPAPQGQAQTQAQPDPGFFGEIVNQVKGLLSSVTPQMGPITQPSDVLSPNLLGPGGQAIWNLAKNSAQNFTNEGGQAVDALAHGNLRAGVSHGISAVPVVGPAISQAAQHFASGQYGAGIADTLPLVAAPITEEVDSLIPSKLKAAKAFDSVAASAKGVWAQTNAATLTITARAMGSAGNTITLSVTTNSTQFTAQTSSAALAGGMDGLSEGPDATPWRTDLNSSPRLNRGARDWNRGFLGALKSYGIDAAVSFSMELQHGDDSLTTAIAQRYPNGDPTWVNTPALQTNFGPASTAFWQQVYLDMADVMAEAGMVPYLQFGEVQWWYFAAPSGMPFYDDYAKSTFQNAYSRAMQVIPSQNSAPGSFPNECAFLPGLIGQFTDSIMAFVRQSHPNARFEVLYPPDVNDTPLNQIINLPRNSWTPAKLNCFKTENFTFTGNRDLNNALASIELPISMGFVRSQASHLVGISDHTTPWEKEWNLSFGQGLESVVLFALDQFCLIGYNPAFGTGSARALYMGG